MPVLIVYGPKLNVERLTDAAASMYGTGKSAITAYS